MRFTILLTLCVLGVASASSLNKRGLAEDLENQTQNAFKALQEFSHQAKDNAEKALKGIMDFLKKFNNKPEAEATEEKTVEKRDLAENLQKLSEKAKENFEKNLKALQDFLARFNKHPSEAPVESAEVEAEAEVETVAKREVDNGGPSKLGNVTAGSLLKNILHPEKLQEQLITLLVNAMAGRNKRDLAENLQKLSEKAKENFEKNLKSLQEFFAQFTKHPSEAPVESAEVEAEAEVETVAKREADNGLPKLGNVSAGSLLSNLFNPKKLQEQLTTVLVNAMAGRNKRDLAENLQKLTGQAKENFEKNLKALQEFFAQFTKKAEAEVAAEVTEEKTVEKRENNPLEFLENFLKEVQTKGQNAGAEVEKAFKQFLAQFQKKTEAPEEVAAPAA